MKKILILIFGSLVSLPALSQLKVNRPNTGYYYFIEASRTSGVITDKGRKDIIIEATDTNTYVLKWTKERKYADPVAVPVQLEAEGFTTQSGTHAVTGGRGVTSTGAYLTFTKDFGAVGLVKASINYARPSGSTSITVRTGSATGPVLCTIPAPSTGSWSAYKTSDFFMLSTPLKGTQTIYVVFVNANDMDLNWIKFN